MGLFKRLHRITIGRIEAFLNRVEDPEIVFPQLIREMEEQLQTAAEEEAKAAASLKKAEIEVEKNADRIDKLGRGAALAVKEGDEKTARDAVAAQLDVEEVQAQAQDNLQRAGGTLDRAQAARKQIQAQLEELKAKKNDIIMRSRVAKARKKIQETVSGSVGSTDSILDAVARLEAHVEETEAELELQAKLAGDASTATSPSLEKRLEELDRNAEIEKRLAALKGQAGDEAE